MCFYFHNNFCLKTVLILKRIQRDMIKNVKWSSCEVPVILVRFLWSFNFLHSFSEKKNAHISNFMKILQVGAQLFHVDSRTDSYDEANNRFSQFCERA
jgi:hypothetical protein